MDKDERVLPCPFCGGVPFVFHDWDSEYHDWHVECEKCSNRTSMWDAEESAIKRWNTRHADAKTLAIMDKERWAEFESSMPREGIVYPKGAAKASLIARIRKAFSAPPRKDIARDR